jgi:hypothetical protein
MYTPTEKDKEFAIMVVKHMKHDCLWELPSNGQVFRINKNDRRLELVAGSFDSFSFERHQAIFSTVGYTIMDAREHIVN